MNDKYNTIKLKKFFTKSDWVSATITFLFSLIIYTLTLQPTVGLEDSGELIVASDFLGVPHPPGYPIWTLLTWFFQWIFHSFTFHGHPNPAWAVNWFSAFSGALACGIITLLISKSGKDLLEVRENKLHNIDVKTKNLFSNIAGISGGLLLAFGQGMWSQAVIAEVYTLNILFQSLVLIFLYRWMKEPNNRNWLYLCAFIFGLGITNHQTLLFMGLAIALAVLLKEPKLFLKFLLVGMFYFILIFAHKLIGPTNEKWLWTTGPSSIGFWFWTIYILTIPLLSILFLKKDGKTVGFTYLLLFLGLSFYFYMPFSSDQNPPINWGYPRTWEGFMHAITRGQYERVTLAAVFSSKFLTQLSSYLMDLRSQFYGPIALLAIIPFFFLSFINKKNIYWLITTLIAFLSVGIVFMILQNPKTDIQNLFIGRVQYIQSHAIYVLWLGYGLLFIMSFLQSLVKNNQLTKIIGISLVLILPLTLIYKNYNDKNQLMIVGGAEQNGHDYGWQFGNWQLRGYEGIKSDFQYWYPNQEDFNRHWESYPCHGYPPAMNTNAIFFGGTDPGRFVPTYMIYSAKVRPDVYLITQNALADNTYMNVMRDLYGEQIWIPTGKDSSNAFSQYINDVKSGKISAGADIATENGKVQIQGVAGVMQINALLCKQIFENNKFKTEKKNNDTKRESGSAVVYESSSYPYQERSFYIEESYPMQWMYPYLTPHGLIMKLNNSPTELSDELINNDRLFWDWNCKRLLNEEKFIRDIVARKSFSKLRCSIANLYEARKLYEEAEFAFRQAIELYDLSPEANFKLANLLAQQNRFDESIDIITNLYNKDRKNESLSGYIKTLKLHQERSEIEGKIKSNKLSKLDLFRLYEIYVQLNLRNQADLIAYTIINNSDNEELFNFIKLISYSKNEKVINTATEKYISNNSNSINSHLNIASIQLLTNKKNEMYKTFQKCINENGLKTITILRNDKRFDSIKNEMRFKKILNSNINFSKPLLY